MGNRGISWGWILFLLIFCWPIGLFLAIRKMATDRAALMSGKRGGISIVGWLLASFGAMGFFLEIFGSRDSFGLGFAFVLMLGGGLLLRKAAMVKKTAVRYKRYIELVVNQNLRHIDDIAAIIGISYEVAIKDLQEMIRMGYLKGAYIPMGTREIVFARVEHPVHWPIAPEPVPMRAFQCPGCGANQVAVSGGMAVCEYCDTKVNV